jgi:hypothetical protein
MANEAKAMKKTKPNTPQVSA